MESFNHLLNYSESLDAIQDVATKLRHYHQLIHDQEILREENSRLTTEKKQAHELIIRMRLKIEELKK